MTQLDLFGFLDAPVEITACDPVPGVSSLSSEAPAHDATLEFNQNHYIADAADYWDDLPQLNAFLDFLRDLVRQERGVASQDVQLERAAALRAVKVRVTSLSLH